MIGIYLIENKINGKKYVGQSIDIERRWKDYKKKVLCETDNRVFSSMNECCDFYNVSRSSLRKHLKNGKPLKGRLFIWV